MDTRKKRLDATLVMLIPADLKRSLFEVAAQRDVPASKLVRDSIASILEAA